MKKKLFYTICILVCAVSMAAADTTRPLLAVSPIRADSPGSMAFARLVRAHLDNIAGTTGLFEMVNPDVLEKQIDRYGCEDEQCQVRFSRDAGISFLIRGEVKDRGDYYQLTLYSYGIRVPHFGKMINRYSVQIPVKNARPGEKEYSYMAEEHAGFFLASFCRGCRVPVEVQMKNNSFHFTWPDAINGDFALYSFRDGDTGIDTGVPSLYDRVGEVEVSNNNIDETFPSTKRHEAAPVIPGDFILLSLHNTADYLEEFYRGRKREMVFDEASADDTCLVMAFTVPASASMPLVVPLLGYYQKGDYTGLGLWAVNTIPYLYMEYHGLRNSPESLREDKKNISRQQVARNYFGWYMLLAGGLPQFVDAFSSDYLDRASNYTGQQPLMGNTATAVYLSLVSGGGGHFYRGYRGWGYLYYHVQNLLLYGFMYNWAQPEYYNETTGEYEKGNRNKKTAYIYASALGTVKIIEILHVLFTENNIRNGNIEEKMYTLTPVMNMGDEGEMQGGVAITIRY